MRGINIPCAVLLTSKIADLSAGSPVVLMATPTFSGVAGGSTVTGTGTHDEDELVQPTDSHLT